MPSLSLQIKNLRHLQDNIIEHSSFEHLLHFTFTRPIERDYTRSDTINYSPIPLFQPDPFTPIQLTISLSSLQRAPDIWQDLPHLDMWQTFLQSVLRTTSVSLSPFFHKFPINLIPLCVRGTIYFPCFF